MNKKNELYTAGIWIVKKGKETEFIQTWIKFAEWTSQNVMGAGNANLLQDTEKLGRFISFGPWKSAENIEEWRKLPEFKQFFAKAKQLCESIQPNTLKTVASIE